MKLSELDYSLPPELIAQRPLARRDDSRLLVYDRASGAIRHRRFTELPDELARDELVVVNDTRVIPARIRIERLRAGRHYGPVELVEHLGEGRWLLRLDGEPAGEMPLPPYITEALSDPERYQTVYAEAGGSSAAPTAGLHFTPELLAQLDVERVTLHVGLDTFRPIASHALAGHELHSERYEVDAAAWDRICVPRHVLAVGTTTVRVLESLSRG